MAGMGGQATDRARAHAEAQRQRILDAAQRCFVQHGFHAASMAGVASAAGISAGLIYRYFASKNDIILAIIERQLGLSRSEVGGLHHSRDLPLDIWKAVFEPTADADRMDPGLYAETSAEAARDPGIATAVAESDRILREDFSQWLARPCEQGGLGLPPDQAGNVGLLIQCLVDGLRMRRLREPDVDPARVQHALRELLRPWLSGRTTDKR